MIETSNYPKQLSLVFVNYRSIFRLSQSLRSLERDPFFRGEAGVIVVNQDDAERKAMEALSEQQGFRLIQRENLGFASGANVGAAVATGRYIAFLNPDALYYSGSLGEVLKTFEREKQVGLIGATLCDKRGIPERWSKGRMLTLSLLVRNNMFPKKFLPADGPVDWVSGGALFIRKALFHSLGGFNEDFFLYFEDMDLCARVKQAGFSVQSSQGLQFCHDGGKSFSSKKAQKKHYFDSQQRYFKKHRPFWEQKLLALLHVLRVCHI